MTTKAETKPINVLLVDDDAGDRRLVKHMLAAASRDFVQFNVQTNETLDAAVDRLDRDECDIVLLDLGLPDSHGIETVKKVHRANPKAPIVVLTGLNDQEMGVEAIKCGAEDYLVKGASLEYLLVHTIRYAIERKKSEAALRESEGKLSAMLSSISDNMSMVDRELNIIWVNETAKKIFGDDIVGKKCYQVYHKKDKPCQPCITLETFKDGKVHEHDTEVIGKNGEIIYFHCLANVALRDEDGRPTAVLEISRDVTRQKQTEKKQAELLKEIESINQELKDFAYVISHDLKEPLRGVKTLADWIAMDYVDKFDEDGKEQIRLLSVRVDRMHNLIDGVLQYSRVGRVKEELVQANLNELVNSVIDMLTPPENIAITIENELPVIECEQTRIVQVFQNLLSNAIKYMDKPDGQIKVGCVEEDGFWKFSVDDNGLGIEEKNYEKIFKMFQTLSSRDEFESTGIGLTVVKKIVELYGGEIWVESEKGKGSTFLFTLPKRQSGVLDDQRLKAHIAC